jgi:hypothetical protein
MRSLTDRRSVVPHTDVFRAAARKLLLLIYTLWKFNSVHIPDYKLIAPTTLHQRI